MRRWVNIRFCQFEVVMILRGMRVGSRGAEGGCVALGLGLWGTCEV